MGHSVETRYIASLQDFWLSNKFTVPYFLLPNKIKELRTANLIIMNIAFELDLDKINLTDEQFFQLCQNNPDMRFERTASGELIIMSPTGSITGESQCRFNLSVKRLESEI